MTQKALVNHAEWIKDLALTVQIGAMIFILAVIVIHVLIAAGVYQDSKSIVRKRGSLFLFDATVWASVILVTGIAGFALYWVIHHSKLRSHGLPLVL